MERYLRGGKCEFTLGNSALVKKAATVERTRVLDLKPRVLFSPFTLPLL